MASGALPPALPMVRIGKKYYSDGGLVSNTPLMHLLDNCGSRNTLVFQVDLFSARGKIPRDIPGRIFSEWCAKVTRPALPAETSTVALYRGIHSPGLHAALMIASQLPT